MSDAIDCPRCGLMNTSAAEQCDCGLLLASNTLPPGDAGRAPEFGGFLIVVWVYLVIVQPLSAAFDVLPILLLDVWGSTAHHCLAYERVLAVVLGIAVAMDLRAVRPGAAVRARAYFLAMAGLVFLVSVRMLMSTGNVDRERGAQHLLSSAIELAGFGYFFGSKRVRLTYWSQPPNPADTAAGDRAKR